MTKYNIIKRIEQLEKKLENHLPVVLAEYKNGECVEYEAVPPMEHIFRKENPIIRTYGSDFAELLNVIIHPAPNRNIEDFE